MRVSSMQPDTASVGPQARAARVKRMLLGILFVPEISLDGLGLLADRLRHHQVLPKPSDWGVKSLVLTQFFSCKYNSVDFRFGLAPAEAANRCSRRGKPMAESERVLPV